jgi:hypothetical protein
MRAAPFPLSRLVIASALAASCAVALAPSAHADPGRGWDRHSAHGRPHFDPPPRHGHPRAPIAWHAPRYPAPRYYAPPRPHAHLAPLIGAGILLGAAVALASPPAVVAAPPPPVVVVPAPMYGVTELGPVRY